MAEARARMMNDLRTISRCHLYRQLRQHSFCTDCDEKRGRPGERNFCSVCQAFFASNFGGIRRKHFLNKLAELHRIQLERCDKLVGVKTLVIPFVEKFDVDPVEQNTPFGYQMAWLEDRIYILIDKFSGVFRVRIFSGEAPFRETSEPIDMTGLAHAMRASATSRSIFITDGINCSLWKIQMPGSVISQWKIDGLPTFMSISAADEVVVFVQSTQNHSFSLHIYRAADVTLLRIVDISAEIKVSCRFVVSPNGTFIFAYNNPSRSNFFLISELSADGKNVLRTFDIRSFKSINMKFWLPVDLAIVEDERIFLADNNGHIIFLLNREMTDYQLLIEHSVVEPYRLSYIRHKQQMVVGELNHDEPRVSILHLSPCVAI